MNLSVRPATVFCLLFSIIVFYIFNRVALTFEGLSGNPLQKINDMVDFVYPSIKARPFMIGTSKVCLLSGLCGAVGAWLFYIYHTIGSKKYMRGIEHGSAEWGTRRDIAPFVNKEDADKNIILSASELLSMTKAKDFEYDRNKNVIVVGGSGSGKTYSFIKPNLMQLHSSYVITDPKGTILPETGYLFLENGYRVRSFNTINFKKSMHYNPFVYIKSEKGILKLVNVLIANTNGEGTQSGEDFWVKAERLYYTALIAYIWYEAPEEEKNFSTLIAMLNASEVREGDETFKNAVDIMFDDLEAIEPTHFAVQQYKSYKLSAGDTAKSILISCAARLAPFNIQELREVMRYDELGLDELGDHKTALFVIMSDTDNTYSFVVAMMFSQMFNLLCDKADDEYGGKLPFHVRCMLDEFANIGKIPNFEKLISTIRSREISATMILQSLSQLKSIYKDDDETIIDCCDTFVFLGGKSNKTTKDLSEMIGKTTIDNQNTNETKGQNGSFTLNNQILGRDLIDASEIGRLKRKQCLVLISGTKPFKSQKYDTKSHKRFSFLSDSGKRGTFDITQGKSFEDKHFFDNVNVAQKIDLSELNALV